MTQTTEPEFEFKDAEEEKAFRDGVTEIIRCLVTMQDERDQIKEICDELYTKIGMPKSMPRKVARLLFQNKTSTYAQEADLLIELTAVARPEKKQTT